MLLGPVTEGSLSKTNADLAIMSSGGITAEGFTNSNELIVAAQLKMMAAADRVVLCLDHTKFGRRAMSFCAPLNKLDTVIADAATPRSRVAMLQKQGGEVIVAKG